MGGRLSLAVIGHDRTGSDDYSSNERGPTHLAVGVVIGHQGTSSERCGTQPFRCPLEILDLLFLCGLKRGKSATRGVLAALSMLSRRPLFSMIGPSARSAGRSVLERLRRFVRLDLTLGIWSQEMERP
jgi:hypothetical protein